MSDAPANTFNNLAPNQGAEGTFNAPVSITNNNVPAVGAQSLYQLRSPVASFVGRAHEIDAIVAALTGAGANAVAISGLRGLGGIGKTELAYAAAARLAAHFPDAQLVVALDGVNAAPKPPALALQQLIRAFAPTAQLPDDLHALEGIYRSLLGGKRVLVLADSAAGADQIAPLVPPAGCALLVTSRARFDLDGLLPLDLGRLPRSEAVALLLKRCPRIGEYADALADRCGELPLALQISAALLKARPMLRVETFLAQLADEKQRLNALRDGSAANRDIQAAFNLSYSLLEETSREVFNQLGVFAAPFAANAAAMVVEVPESNGATLDSILIDLYGRSLLDYDEALERYLLHDLVRDFARQRLAASPANDDAWLRYARYSVSVTSEVNRLYYAGSDDLMRGLALFDGERAHIEAARRWLHQQAGRPAVDELILDDANGIFQIAPLRYDNRRERIPQLEAALAAARRLQDREREGHALGNLGNAYADLGEVGRAIEFYKQVLDVMRAIGDRWGEGAALGSLGLAYADLGEVRRAIAFYEQRLEIARAIGDRQGEGNTLGNLGNAYRNLGEVKRAIAFYEQHLEVARAIGDRWGEGNTLGNLGNAYYSLGEVKRAIAFHEQRLEIARAIGDRRGEGNALGNLGLAYADLGEVERAIAFYEQHLEIARAIGDRRGEGAALGNLGNAYYSLGEVGRAIAFHEQHLEVARAIGDRRGEGNALGGLGNAYSSLGEVGRAIAFYEQHLEVARAIGDRQGESITSRNFALLLLDQGERERALPLLETNLAYLQAIGHPDAASRAAFLEHVRAGGGRADFRWPAEGEA